MSTEQSTAQHVDLFVMSSAVLRSGHGVNWLTYVGLDEQMKAAEYRNSDDALNYAAQQTLFRAMAASSLEVRPTQAPEIPVDRTCYLCDSSAEHGKPRIAGVNLSMARTSGMVAGALTAGDMTQDDAPRIGLDIERLRGNFLDGFDRVSLTKNESEVLAELGGEQAQRVRLMLWTGKEAVLKATGHGLNAGLQSVEVNLDYLPRQEADIAGTSTHATLSLPAQEPVTFWITWQKQDEYFIAVALDQPMQVVLHPVTLPVDIKRVLNR